MISTKKANYSIIYIITLHNYMIHETRVINGYMNICYDLQCNTHFVTLKLVLRILYPLAVLTITVLPLRMFTTSSLLSWISGHNCIILCSNYYIKVYVVIIVPPVTARKAQESSAHLGLLVDKSCIDTETLVQAEQVRDLVATPYYYLYLYQKCVLLYNIHCHYQNNSTAVHQHTFSNLLRD